MGYVDIVNRLISCIYGLCEEEGGATITLYDLVLLS